MNTGEIGKWSFIAGILLAILVGALGTMLSDYVSSIAMLLVLLGVVVGFLNITTKKVYDFLVAAIALLLAGAAGLDTLPMVGAYLGPIVAYIAYFVAPAAVIVSLKAIYEIGRKV